MAGVTNKTGTVKRSISFSSMVNQWAEEMAKKNGYGNNFSAYLADLVREAKERETLPPGKYVLNDAKAHTSNSLAVSGEHLDGVLRPVGPGAMAAINAGAEQPPGNSGPRDHTDHPRKSRKLGVAGSK